MYSVLGALMSGSRRLFFAGESHPLCLHVALIASASAESGRWLDKIKAPLYAEVDRLNQTARGNTDLPAVLARHVEHLQTLQRGTADYESTVKAARDMAALCDPHIIAKSDGERDGLHAQVLVADLEAMVLGNDVVGAAKLAATFFCDSGSAATLLTTISPAVARRLAQAPIVTASPGWPLLILPSSAPFEAATALEINQAREEWDTLVKRALLLRYQLPEVIDMGAAALGAINVFRDRLEKEYKQHGAAITCRWAVAALARLAAVDHLLNPEEGDFSVRAVQPLVEWALKAQDSLFPGSAAKPRAARRMMPKRATIADDIARGRRLLEERPTLTDRQAIQILGKRPRGHWKMILEAARNDLANRTTNMANASNT